MRSPRSIRAGALVRAVLAAEWPYPGKTGTVEKRAGMPRDPVVLRMLNRRTADGEVEKVTRVDVKSLYWRLVAAPQVLLAPERTAVTRRLGDLPLTVLSAGNASRRRWADWGTWCQRIEAVSAAYGNRPGREYHGFFHRRHFEKAGRANECTYRARVAVRFGFG